MDIHLKCSELLAAGTDLVLVTVISASSGTPGKPGFKMIAARDGRFFGTVGGGALEMHAQEKAAGIFTSMTNEIEDLKLGDLGMECGGNAVLAYEYLGARSRFLLFGGGHVGRALLPIIESLGYLVTVFDDRKEITDRLTADNGREVILGKYADIKDIETLIDPVDYVFIATQGHAYDYDVLKQLLTAKKTYRYIGLIGSKRKITAACKKLEQDGLAVPEFLYAPVGLKIGGDSAEEIAVSIAAEVISVKNGVEAPHMRTACSSRAAAT